MMMYTRRRLRRWGSRAGRVQRRTGRPLPQDSTVILWLYGKETVVIPAGQGSN